jgi:hypothetical protein
MPSQMPARYAPDKAAAPQHQDRVFTFCHCAMRERRAPKLARSQVRVFINPARLRNLAKNSARWVGLSPRKVNLSRSVSAEVPGARTGRAGRCPGATASIQNRYSLPAELHTVFTPPTISYSNVYASGGKVSWPVSPARRCSGWYLSLRSSSRNWVSR